MGWRKFFGVEERTPDLSPEVGRMVAAKAKRRLQQYDRAIAQTSNPIRLLQLSSERAQWQRVADLQEATGHAPR